jgi:hypothetical protein
MLATLMRLQRMMLTSLSLWSGNAVVCDQEVDALKRQASESEKSFVLAKTQVSSLEQAKAKLEAEGKSSREQVASLTAVSMC